jgi:capsular polysaccharide biosynthesis protein
VASDREITLGDVGQAIWRGKWIVLVTTLVAAAVAAALTFTADTTYTATSRVYLGQATTISGNIASTPGTNPLTAATMLRGDRVVGAVATATGLSPSAVRARTDVAVPRAPGTVTTNQPAIATITATTDDRREAIRIANAYAEAALTTANTGYATVSRTLDAQVRRLRAEESRLVAAARRAPASDAAGQLTGIRELLVLTEVQQARAAQIEAPAMVTIATGAASSTGASNRVRTTITGAIIGLLVGIVIALATRGGLRREPGTT